VQCQTAHVNSLRATCRDAFFNVFHDVQPPVTCLSWDVRRRRPFILVGSPSRFHSEHSFIVPVKFEVFTAVTIKNVVFWDIKTQFVLHRRHITSPLQTPAS
jgi:hypothetical protein